MHLADVKTTTGVKHMKVFYTRETDGTQSFSFSQAAVYPIDIETFSFHNLTFPEDNKFKPLLQIWRKYFGSGRVVEADPGHLAKSGLLEKSDSVRSNNGPDPDPNVWDK